MKFLQGRKKTLSARYLIAFSTLIFFSQSLFATETSGYLRSGLGVSEGGVNQECYRALGAIAKHRLGNECENYMELALTQKFPGKPGEYSFIARVLFAFQSLGHRDWESTNVSTITTDANGTATASQDATIAFREAYVSASKDFLSAPVFWAGKRFYRRRDIHMLDYFLHINTGSGFGVENINTAGLTWHAALLKNVPPLEGPSQTNIDIRLRGLKVPLLGSLETTFIYGMTSDKDAYTSDRKWSELQGFATFLMFDQSLKSGFQLFAVQYGTGLFGAVGPWGVTGIDQFGAWGSQNIEKANSESVKNRKRSSTVRFVDQWVYKFSESFSHSLVLLYQDVDFGGHVTDGLKRPNLRENTIGSRPIWHINKNFSLQTELGFTKVENAVAIDGEYKDSELAKITIAPTLTRDSQYFSRPQLRLFATQAFWNKDSQGKVSQNVYSRQTKGWSAGAQIEVWW